MHREFFTVTYNCIEILQVEVAADTVACICASASSNGENLYVVDAGGGKGYLSTHLALEYKIKVLGVDWNPDHTLNALNRSEKLVVITKLKISKRIFIN